MTDPSHCLLKLRLFRLFFTLFSALFFAFFIVWNLVRYYDLDSSYKAKQVLLSASNLENFVYRKHNERNGGYQNYVFKDLITKTFSSEKPIHLSVYRDLLELLINDKSVTVEDKIKNLFKQEKVFSLHTIFRKQSMQASSDEDLFQSIDFFPGGNYWRVCLYNCSLHKKFVYFFHPKIGDKAMGILQGNL